MYKEADAVLRLNTPECTSVFLGEEMFWMNFPVNVVSGKFDCPHCSFRIGRWNWAGTQCSCGRWISPALQFPLTRVEEDTIAKTFNCSKCRGHLFDRSDVSYHEQGEGETSFPWKKRDNVEDINQVKENYLRYLEAQYEEGLIEAQTFADIMTSANVNLFNNRAKGSEHVKINDENLKIEKHEKGIHEKIVHAKNRDVRFEKHDFSFVPVRIDGLEGMVEKEDTQMKREMVSMLKKKKEKNRVDKNRRKELRKLKEEQRKESLEGLKRTNQMKREEKELAKKEKEKKALEKKKQRELAEQKRKTKKLEEQLFLEALGMNNDD